MRQHSKKEIILLVSLLFIFFSNLSICQAEKIYLKNAGTKDADVLYSSKGTLWIKINSGAVGINREEIEKIENDDGSISKYDYKSILSKIKELAKENKFNEAVALCDLLMESFPSDNEIYYLRGLLNHKGGNLVKATEDYLYLVNHQAADAKIFNNLGAIYANLGRNVEAKDEFKQALARDSGSIEARNNLAELFLRIKEYASAIEEYNQVVKLEPNNIRALYNLGVAYLNNNNYAQAKVEWEKILAIAPEDKEALKALESLNMEKRQG